MSRVLRVGLAAVLVFGSAAVAAPGTAVAAGDDGTVTVQVLRDFFGTGIINATMDTPQQGMLVTLSDPAGHQVQAMTDATGKVTVAPSAQLVGGQYRVDVAIPASQASYLRPAPASVAENHFNSFVSFVDVRAGKDASVVTGVWNPNDYALPDSKYYVPVQTPRVDKGGKPLPADGRALVSFAQDSRGSCNQDKVCPDKVDTQAQVGTTWGLAYDKYRKRLFQGAFAKRFTTFGPGGGGAIYTLPTDGSGTPSVYAQVPAAALTPHTDPDARRDTGYVDVPGKEGLGGIAMTEDGSTLYAVNLLSKTLVSFDATRSRTAPVKNIVPIPDPGCAAATDWRPFAVAAHDAKLYVGGVCDAESTHDRADLKAVVYTFADGKFTPILTHGLDYLRGAVANATVRGDKASHWNPWDARLSNWDDRAFEKPEYGELYIDPQPELASLAFSRNGSMILGFRDRFMDVLGSGGLDPRNGDNNPVAETGMSGGDITMACSTTTPGRYDWEGEGDCPNHGTAATNGNEAGNPVEYFPGDFYDPNKDGQANTHEEAAQGSVAYIPQQQYVISTELDPAQDVNSDGVGFYDVDTGTGPGQDNPKNGFEFVDSDVDTEGFAKAGGLGDVAYEGANAPIQIGNIVWFDGDHNGIQDPYSATEVPLAGATVNLKDAGGNQVATTQTDAAGEYYFGGVGADYQLTQAGKYTVEFNVCTAKTDNVPTTPPATALRFTLPTAGKDTAHDNNVVPPTTGPLCDGSTDVTAPAEAGGVDHTIDAGVYIPGPKLPTPPGTPPPGSPPPGSPPPGGISVHTGGYALADNAVNWWWIGLGALGVVALSGGALWTVRTRLNR